jgi:DNA-binding NarL/FixJ family response regulator
MDVLQLIQDGRSAHALRAWGDAYASLSRADGHAALEGADLERLAMAAYLSGRDAESAEVWARAHRAFLGGGEVERAARCGLWLAFGLMRRGERARAGGWIARVQRLLDDQGLDCVERGYLLLPEGHRHIGAGDVESAYDTFCRAAEIADRFDDADLTSLALHSRGRILLRLGEIEEGVRLLDEAMASVEAGDLSPLVVGDVYCSVIEGCLEIFDLRRAQEWTAVLTHWCEAQEDLVPYRGQCLARRAEIMQLHGAWPDALAEAQRACEWLARPPGEPAAGAAFYQQAELHRLRGEMDEAEEAYREASRWGKNPQPGLAQLRLAQGRVDAAEAAIRQAEAAAQGRWVRSRLLPAYVEIMLAAGDHAAASAAADELDAMAAALDAPLLRAAAAGARGAVLLAAGDADAALPALREAWAGWQEVEAPHEAARVRGLLGLAHRELGDGETAEMELDAARCAFEQLGAAPDLARLREDTGAGASDAAGRLTPREVQVLRLVAAGKTNRSIAGELFISEKTVARHLSNVFVKLDLSNRAAATAYAYEHGLVPSHPDTPA